MSQLDLLGATAVVSPPVGRVYRYLDTERWANGPRLGWLLLHPDPEPSENLRRKLREYAERERCGSYSACYLFGLVADQETFLTVAKVDPDAAAGPDADAETKPLLEACDVVACAWGHTAGYTATHRFLQLLERGVFSGPALCVGMNGVGYPLHPVTAPDRGFMRRFMYESLRQTRGDGLGLRREDIER